MALRGGHRFAVGMGEVFPAGVFALGVEQAEDYDERSGRRSPAKDKQSGELVWTVTCVDRDPEARAREVRVKVSAPVRPVLPGEIVPGTGLHEVEFTGLTVTPYVNEGRGRARLAFSLRATGVHGVGRVSPGGGSSGTGRRSSGADSKAA
jgi:hypothetical protein